MKKLGSKGNPDLMICVRIEIESALKRQIQVIPMLGSGPQSRRLSGSQSFGGRTLRAHTEDHHAPSLFFYRQCTLTSSSSVVGPGSLMRAIQRFGKQLQRLRTSRGLTQEQLAVTAGLSRTFLTRLELGQHDPSLSTLVRVAKALRVSVTELLGESASASRWWQVGETRFATREEAEAHARTAGEMFVVQYQNKSGGPERRLFPLRQTK